MDIGAVPGPGGLPNMANLSSFFNSPAVMNMVWCPAGITSFLYVSGCCLVLLGTVCDEQPTAHANVSSP